MTSAIISGAGGQLGKAFIDRLPFTEDYSLFTFDHAQLDIADQDKIHRTLASLPQVKYWINCAAYTKVDDAETNEKAASLYNSLAPGYLARACWEAGVHLIHFSTDYVYHNNLRRPLREDDPTEPKSVYAKTKLEGEQEIIYSGASHTIIRTSWVYGPGGHNFVNTMLRLGRIKDELRIVGDQVGAPTFTYDIVDAVKDIIRLHEEEEIGHVQGVFNFANSGEVSWADFAKAIFKYNSIHCQVNTITTEEYGAPAARPPYSVLNCEKISELISSPVAHWEDALQRYLLMP
ncbi:MAG TPA: dTDP-4-dehydrorhamnose reductase [Saprospiraceae bacterium]|nr:dTDP-4-dehydrorhamnose reductase [Saprospiraceae bacterium]